MMYGHHKTPHRSKSMQKNSIYHDIIGGVRGERKFEFAELLNSNFSFEEYCSGLWCKKHEKKDYYNILHLSSSFICGL